MKFNDKSYLVPVFSPLHAGSLKYCENHFVTRVKNSCMCEKLIMHNNNLVYFVCYC